MLLPMHSQGQDRCVLTCTECKQRVETGWHCPGCEDYDLCINCYNTKGHTHEMVKVGLGLDEEAEVGDEGGYQGERWFRSPLESRRQAIQGCILSLVHAWLKSCLKMKRVVLHTKRCQRKTNGGCPRCMQLIALCCYHARHCQENPCPFPSASTSSGSSGSCSPGSASSGLGTACCKGSSCALNNHKVPQQSAVPSLSTTLDTPTAAQHTPDTTASASVPALACKHVTSRLLQLGQNFAPPVSTGKPTHLRLQPSLQPGVQNLNAMRASAPTCSPSAAATMGGLNPQGQALNIIYPGRNPSVASMNHSTERCRGAAAAAGKQRWHGCRPGRTRPVPAASGTLMPPAAMQQPQIQQQIRPRPAKPC